MSFFSQFSCQLDRTEDYVTMLRDNKYRKYIEESVKNTSESPAGYVPSSVLMWRLTHACLTELCPACWEGFSYRYLVSAYYVWKVL